MECSESIAQEETLAVNVLISKENRSQIRNLNFHLKKPKKEKQGKK